MRSPKDMVREVHEVFDHPYRTEPTELSHREKDLLHALLYEESEEAIEAVSSGSLADLAKELADVIYVAYSVAAFAGIDLDAVLAEVHRSNMTKASKCITCIGTGEVTRRGLESLSKEPCTRCGGKGYHVEKRSDGKVLKGPAYQPPNIEAVLRGG